MSGVQVGIVDFAGIVELAAGSSHVGVMQGHGHRSSAAPGARRDIIDLDIGDDAEAGATGFALMLAACGGTSRGPAQPTPPADSSAPADKACTGSDRAQAAFSGQGSLVDDVQ